MTEGFDKEMDALLRQAAQGETVSAAGNPKSNIQNSKSPHLDADEISLFAESGLPKKLRENAVAHFADCDRCRKILSDLIAHNSENEVVSAKQAEVFVQTIPWYRKLFAFPNLAYTLGALVLVFSGLIAFTIVQSVDNAKNTEVSQISERPLNGKGMSADGDAAVVERNVDAPMPNMSSNSAMSSAAAAMSNSAPAYQSNQMTANTSISSAARGGSNANAASNISTTSNNSVASDNSSVSASETAKEQARSESEPAKKTVDDLLLQGAIANNLAQQKRDRAREEDKKTAETTDTARAAPPAAKPEQSSVSKNKTSSAAPDAVARRAESAAINVGGKNFRRENGVYIDSAYRDQATTGVTRGTKEYKKLDSSLRGIVENLGGTVIVVWKDKAYRIQ